MNGWIQRFNRNKAPCAHETSGANMSVDTSEGHEAMDYPEHERTYAGFIKVTIWGTAVVLLILVLMAVFLL